MRWAKPYAGFLFRLRLFSFYFFEHAAERAFFFVQFARSPRDFAQRHTESSCDLPLRRTLVDFFDEKPPVCKVLPFRRRKKTAEKIADKALVVRFGDKAAELQKTFFERFLCRAFFCVFRCLSAHNPLPPLR